MVTLARHNLFLLAAHGTLKTLPKKVGGTEKNEEKDLATRRRELLRGRARANLIFRWGPDYWKCRYATTRFCSF